MSSTHTMSRPRPRRGARAVAVLAAACAVALSATACGSSGASGSSGKASGHRSAPKHTAGAKLAEAAGPWPGPVSNHCDGTADLFLNSGKIVMSAGATCYSWKEHITSEGIYFKDNIQLDWMRTQCGAGTTCDATSKVYDAEPGHTYCVVSQGSYDPPAIDDTFPDYRLQNKCVTA